MSRTLGIFSGILYITLFLILIPILISLNPEFVISTNKIDPLSKLGVNFETAIYYNLMQGLGGLLIFIFYHYNFQKKKFYIQLDNWDKTIKFGQLAVFGQVTMGIFANIEILHTYHLIVGLFFFVGIILSIFTISLDFKHSNNSELYILTYLAYVICLIGFSYPFYFRYTRYTGLWQFLLLGTIMSWFIIEEILYSRIHSREEYVVITREPNFFMIKLVGVILALGIIVLSLIMLYFPSIELANCGTQEAPKICAPADNYLSLGFAFILLFISGKSYIFKEKIA